MKTKKKVFTVEDLLNFSTELRQTKKRKDFCSRMFCVEIGKMRNILSIPRPSRIPGQNYQAGGTGFKNETIQAKMGRVATLYRMQFT